MSTQENSTPNSDLSSEQAITIQPSAIAAYPAAADWPAAGEGEQPQGAAMGLDVLLHAIRRHWLVISAAGVAMAVLVGTLAFLAIKPKYESAGHFVDDASESPYYVGPDRRRHRPRRGKNFAIFKNNQARLIKEPYVIQAALRNNKLKNLPSIVREDARHNTIPWMKSVIQASAEKTSGLMDVTASLPDANEATVIVNAVVEAYIDEVVLGDGRSAATGTTACSASRPTRKRMFANCANK